MVWIGLGVVGKLPFEDEGRYALVGRATAPLPVSILR